MTAFLTQIEPTPDDSIPGALWPRAHYDLSRGAWPRPQRCTVRARPTHQRPELHRYVEQCLVPTRSPAMSVIMDNLRSNKRPVIRETSVARVPRSLLRPPFGPALNPIAQVFAKAQAPDAKGRRVIPMRQLIGASARSSIPSPPMNAETISLTPATVRPNVA